MDLPDFPIVVRVSGHGQQAAMVYPKLVSNKFPKAGEGKDRPLQTVLVCM
jgi:hypothetical protein